MARKNRLALPGIPQHVVNRGNDRQAIFLDQFDYAVFIELLAQGVQLSAVKLYGFCLMPNHFHLLIEAAMEDGLSAFMQRLEGLYACHFRRRTCTLGHGHVLQRRFWNAAAHDEQAFLAILRYIEANPVRSNSICSADLWPWSSFLARKDGGRRILTPLPVQLPDNWLELVNGPQPPQDVERIRKELVPGPGRPRTREAKPARRVKTGQALFVGGGEECGEYAEGAYERGRDRIAIGEHDDLLRRA